MALKIIHTDFPNFNFDEVTMEVTMDPSATIGRMDNKAFESLGAFLEYGERNFDCIVMLMGLKSFGDLLNTSTSKPMAQPIFVIFWGYAKWPSPKLTKTSLKFFF